MTNKTILVIEDSSDSFNLISRSLGALAKIEWARTQKDASQLLQKNKYDLVLLDIHLPDGSGFQLCSLLKAHDRWNSTPIIFVTAQASIPDRVMGFSVGADDYITKPFDMLELKARVEAKLRKLDRLKEASDKIVRDGLEINKRTQQAFVLENGEQRLLDLTPIEFRLLLLLASDPNKAFSRDEILDRTWGQNVHVYHRSVDTHISKLRRKLGDKNYYVASVHGVGYRFSMDETPKVLRPAGEELHSSNLNLEKIG